MFEHLSDLFHQHYHNSESHPAPPHSTGPASVNPITPPGLLNETHQSTRQTLQRLLASMARHTDDYKLDDTIQQTLYNTLFSDTFVVPVCMGGHDFLAPILKADTQPSLCTLFTRHGEQVIALFTSLRECQDWCSETGFVTAQPTCLTINTIATMVIGAELDGILLEPNRQEQHLLDYQICSYLAEGMHPPVISHHPVTEHLGAERMVHLAPPYDLPQSVTERLHGFFERNAQWVHSAYSFQIAYQQKDTLKHQAERGQGKPLIDYSSGPMKYALGLQLTETGQAVWHDTLWPALSCVLQEVLGPKEYLDIYRLNTLPELAESLPSITTPFYIAP